jgi:hypothetical protein
LVDGVLFDGVLATIDQPQRHVWKAHEHAARDPVNGGLENGRPAVL